MRDVPYVFMDSCSGQWNSKCKGPGAGTYPAHKEPARSSGMDAEGEGGLAVEGDYVQPQKLAWDWFSV